MLRPPLGHIFPKLSATDDSALQWRHAGTYLPGSEQGTMCRTERIVQKIWFGCNPDRLYLRLDLAQPTPPFTLLLTVTQPGCEPVTARTALIRKPGRRTFTITRAPGGKVHHRTSLLAGKNVQWELSLRDLDIPEGTQFTIRLHLLADGVERERYPERSFISLCA